MDAIASVVSLVALIFTVMVGMAVFKIQGLLEHSLTNQIALRKMLSKIAIQNGVPQDEIDDILKQFSMTKKRREKELFANEKKRQN